MPFPQARCCLHAGLNDNSMIHTRHRFHVESARVLIVAGQRIATRLQGAVLSALTGESEPAGDAQSGGGFLAIAADSQDDPNRPVTTVGKSSNTFATLDTGSNINRYGYSSARDAAVVRVSATCILRYQHLHYCTASCLAGLDQLDVGVVAGDPKNEPCCPGPET